MQQINRIELSQDKKIEDLQKQIQDLRSINLQYKKDAEAFDKIKNDLEVLHSIAETVHQSFNLQHIYDLALDILINVYELGAVLIYLIDENRENAVLQAHRNLSKEYLRNASTIPYPKGVTWKVINLGHVVNIEDIQYDKDVGQAGKDMGLHSTLGVPITLEGVVMGVLWMSRLDQGKFTDQELKLFTCVGEHIAIAIAKAKIYNELQVNLNDRTRKLQHDNSELKLQLDELKSTLENQTISKDSTDRNELENIIRSILSNEYNLEPSIQDQITDQVRDEITDKRKSDKHLSSQERKVLSLIASGMGMKQIADEIYVSPSTVSTYRARILEKLNLKSTAELIRYAIQNELIFLSPLLCGIIAT